MLVQGLVAESMTLNYAVNAGSDRLNRTDRAKTLIAYIIGLRTWPSEGVKSMGRLY